MTSLEFIEKQILLVKQNIQYHKNLLADSDKEYTNEILSVIKLLEPELQILLQIKYKLEAWEFTKRELGLEIVEHYNDTFKTKYALKCDYQDVIPLVDNEVESFKKALEVENE